MPSTQSAIPRRSRPCAECPWRRDVPAGQFTRQRFEALASTAGQPGAEIALGGPLFACHRSTSGRDRTCAGWLAVVGHHHLGVRLAVIQGQLPSTALAPGADWPPLFDSYCEMAEAQGRRVDA